MATIGSLTYSLVAKTDGFKQGLAGSGRALRDQKKLFLATRTDAEKYSLAIDRLEHLHKSGKVSTDVYTRSMAQLKTEMRGGDVAVSGFVGGMNKALPAITAAATGLIAIRLASSALRSSMSGLNSVISNTQEAFERLDVVAKASDKLGLLESDLIGLRMAAAEFSGFAGTQFDTAMQRMTRRIAEAAAGSGEAQMAIKQLGLDAKLLSAAGPAEAFKRLADAIQRIPGEGDKLRLAFKLFDSEGAGLVSTLSAGGEAIQDVIDEANRLHETEFINFAAIEAANDSVGRLFAALEGKFNIIASELAPLVSIFANELTGSLLSANASGQTFSDTMFGISVQIANAADMTNLLIAATEKFFLGTTQAFVAISAQDNFVVQLVKAREKLQEETRKAAEAGAGLVDVSAFEAAEKKVQQVRESAEKKAAADRISAIKEAGREEMAIIKRAEAIRDSFKTPTEKLAEAKAEVTQAFLGGLIDDVTLGRAFASFAEKADGLRGPAAGRPAGTVGAVHAGSIEALRIQQGNSRAPDERTAKSTEELVKKETESLKIQRDMLQAMLVLSGGVGGLISSDSA